VLKLTVEQKSLIATAAAPLPPGDRKRFEARVLEQLSQVAELGDGAVHRACREAQRACLTPPTATEVSVEPRHGRP
jgi:hypothetical protein